MEALCRILLIFKTQIAEDLQEVLCIEGETLAPGGLDLTLDLSAQPGMIFLL